MKTYELIYIISSQISSEEAGAVKKEVESFIQSNGAVVLNSDLSLQKGKTGIQTLSYPIKKQSSGYFNISVFQVEEEKIKEIKDNLDKNSKILRSIIAVKKPHKEIKVRRTRRPMTIPEFEIKRKPYIREPAMREPKE